MTILLFAMLLLTEAAFLIAAFPAAEEKRIWNKKRLLVHLCGLAVFGIMLLLPDISLSFRFLGLFAFLILRIIFSGIRCLLCRNNTKIKTKAGKTVSFLLGIIMTAFAMMPAFIFKEYNGRPLSGTYTPAVCAAILTDRSRTETFEQDGSAREIPVHIYYPAENAGIADHSLPLVLFSHGAFGWYQSNLSAYLELASNGYVVVSLDHPYHALFTKDTSGKLITVNGQFMQDAMRLNESTEKDTEQDAQTILKWADLRQADMNFAVDTLKSAASGNDFTAWTFTEGTSEQFETAAQMINTEKIGLMGHSLGGSTAVTVGRRGDIAAVIDIDGTMLGEYTGFANGEYQINPEPYPVPLLSIDNEDHHRMREEAQQTGSIYVNNVVLDHAETGFSTYFAGAGHMNFTDLPLISPVLANALGTGEIDPAECTDRLNSLILSFFDCYLKDQGNFSITEQN